MMINNSQKYHKQGKIHTASVKQETFNENLKWEQIFQAVADGLIVIDTEFNVLYINPALTKMAAVNNVESVGRKCYNVFPGTLCKTSACPLLRVLGGAERIESDGKKHCICGKDIPCIVTATPYRDSRGNLIGIVESIKDVSLLKKTEEQLRSSLDRLRRSMGAVIQALALTIEKRDPYTAGHQRRVTKLCRAIATDMGFSWESVQGIRMAAAIHDFGKILVPSAILNRPGRLTENEFGIIKTHPQTAYDILKGIEFPWPLAQNVYQHHERLNGSGYPRGLKGDDILMEARILAVADVVEAMSSHRPYRPSLGIKKALLEIRRRQGIFYDQKVVDTCLKVFTEKKFRF